MKFIFKFKEHVIFESVWYLKTYFVHQNIYLFIIKSTVEPTIGPPLLELIASSPNNSQQKLAWIPCHHILNQPLNKSTFWITTTFWGPKGGHFTKVWLYSNFNKIFFFCSLQGSRLTVLPVSPVDRSRPAPAAFESDDFDQPAAAPPAGKRFQSRRPAVQQQAVEDQSDFEEAPAARAQQPPTRGGVPRQRLQVWFRYSLLKCLFLKITCSTYNIIFLLSDLKKGLFLPLSLKYF